MFDVIKCENYTKEKKIIQNNLHFDLIFLTCWLVHSRLYRAYLEFIEFIQSLTKKELIIRINSIRVSELVNL